MTEEEFNLNNKRMERAQGLKRDMKEVQEAIDKLMAGHGGKLEIKPHTMPGYEISFYCSDIVGEETESRHNKTMRRILISALTQYKQELEKEFEEI